MKYFLLSTMIFCIVVIPGISLGSENDNLKALIEFWDKSDETSRTIFLKYIGTNETKDLEARPSEEEGMSAFSERYTYTGNGKQIAQILWFKKTNGQFENFGVKRYKLFYEAEIQYLDEYRYNFYNTYKKGEKSKHKGFVMFELTENGWVVTSVK